MKPVAQCVSDGEGGVFYCTLSNEAPIGNLVTEADALAAQERAVRVALGMAKTQNLYAITVADVLARLKEQGNGN